MSMRYHRVQGVLDNAQRDTAIEVACAWETTGGKDLVGV